MRRIAQIFLGLALVGATNWFCSTDAPAPTPPRTITPGTNGASALQIRLFTSKVADSILEGLHAHDERYTGEPPAAAGGETPETFGAVAG